MPTLPWPRLGNRDNPGRGAERRAGRVPRPLPRSLALMSVGIFILGFFAGGTFMFVILAMFMAGRRES